MFKIYIREREFYTSLDSTQVHRLHTSRTSCPLTHINNTDTNTLIRTVYGNSPKVPQYVILNKIALKRLRIAL